MTDKLSRETLVSARYGGNDLPANILWNEQIANLLNHRSIRQFLDKPLPEGCIETLVAAAQSASTSSNLQQWSVVAVTDKAMKSEVWKLSSSKGLGNTYIDEAPAILLWVADCSRTIDMTVEDELLPQTTEYLETFLTASLDAALAAQNAAVAAESLGLGIVYIGALRSNTEKLAELISLPRHSYVIFGLVIGWPDPDNLGTIRPRLPQKAVLHYNTYKTLPPNAYLLDYEKAFHTFREGLGMKDKTWKQAVQNATGMAYLGERKHLRMVLERMGFGFR